MQADDEAGRVQPVAGDALRRRVGNVFAKADVCCRLAKGAHGSAVHRVGDRGGQHPAVLRVRVRDRAVQAPLLGDFALRVQQRDFIQSVGVNRQLLDAVERTARDVAFLRQTAADGQQAGVTVQLRVLPAVFVLRGAADAQRVAAAVRKIHGDDALRVIQPERCPLLVRAVPIVAEYLCGHVLKPGQERGGNVRIHREGIFALQHQRARFRLHCRPCVLIAHGNADAGDIRRFHRPEGDFLVFMRGCFRRGGGRAGENQQTRRRRDQHHGENQQENAAVPAHGMFLFRDILHGLQIPPWKQDDDRRQQHQNRQSDQYDAAQ